MGYEGNRRSGVALAMRHRLSGLSTYGLKGQCAGDEHPAHTSGHGPFTIFTIFSPKVTSVGLPVLDILNMAKLLQVDDFQYGGFDLEL